MHQARISLVVVVGLSLGELAQKNQNHFFQNLGLEPKQGCRPVFIWWLIEIMEGIKILICKRIFFSKKNMTFVQEKVQ